MNLDIYLWGLREKIRPPPFFREMPIEPSSKATARRRRGGVNAHFHDLRHSCASLLINMGAPLEVIRDILAARA
jgi:integrase